MEVVASILVYIVVGSFLLLATMMAWGMLEEEKEVKNGKRKKN